MSEFATAESSVSPVKKSWADSESDSDNDEAKNPFKNDVALDQNSLQPDEEIPVDNNDCDSNSDNTLSEVNEDEDDDGSDEEDNGSYKLSTIPATSATTVTKPKGHQNLSKKEKLELRQKELDDLDAILSQFKIEKSNDGENSATEGEPTNSPNIPSEVDEKTKRKRKKKAAVTVANDATSKEESQPIAPDVNKILKSRTTKAKKATVSEAQKVAMAEALKKDSTKKKKKDKSKFSEGSY